MTKAEIIVSAIVDDLCDRAGLGDEWYQIDDDIRAEIVATWKAIVEKADDTGEE